MSHHHKQVLLKTGLAQMNSHAVQVSRHEEDAY